MNGALDKIDGRRRKLGEAKVVDDYGLPDQPMLEEMTTKALQVLKNQKKGFVLMVEGASIDKQAHNMDSERWILDTIEFDRAIKVVQDFAREDGETLVIVTADHECAGVALLGASRLPDQRLQAVISEAQGKNAINAESLRNPVVGIYEQAGFPRYRKADDGYPVTTDIDFRMLVGYGANSDRYEDWRTNARPLQDSQQPFVKTAPLSTYPANPAERDKGVGFMVTGQVPGESAVHTASDIPLSAFGPGAFGFTGVIDNTDVFFRMAQMVVGGVPRFDMMVTSRRK
jgi:alkaline phosphatase